MFPLQGVYASILNFCWACATSSCRRIEITRSSPCGFKPKYQGNGLTAVDLTETSSNSCMAFIWSLERSDFLSHKKLSRTTGRTFGPRAFRSQCGVLFGCSVSGSKRIRCAHHTRTPARRTHARPACRHAASGQANLPIYFQYLESWRPIFNINT